jgi:hypothetical protein
MRSFRGELLNQKVNTVLTSHRTYLSRQILAFSNPAFYVTI